MTVGAQVLEAEQKIREALEEIVDREMVSWDYSSYDSMWSSVNAERIAEHYPFIRTDWVEAIWDAPCSSVELQNRYVEKWRAQFS